MTNKPCLLLAVAMCLVAGQMTTSFAQNTLTNGLVAHYPFNGDANDASGNGDNGVVFGATLTSDRFGSANSAFRFDYTELNAIRTQGSAIPRGLATRTFALWFKQSPRVTGDFIYAPLLSLWDGESQQAFVIEFWGSSLVIKQGAVFNKAFDGPNQPMSDGNWHQLVCIVSTNTVTAYIDGVRVVWNGGLPPPGAQWDLPQGNLWIGYGINTYYDGALDNLRIYNRALSASEIQQLYDLESTPEPPPTLTLIKAVKPSFSGLSLGREYQLLVSGDMSTWTNHGSSFTATNSTMIYPDYFDVENWNGLYFQLLSVP